MSNKTSDKNVATEEDIKILKDKDCAWHYPEATIDEAIEHVLAEREQMKQRYEERDNELWERVKQCNNLQTEIDRIYAEKEELIEINKKQYKQIKELEEELAKYKSLDYMFKINNKENRVDMKKIYFEWLDSIPKKVVKEVLQNNRNELFGMTCLSKEQYRPYEIQIERINKIGQELLGGENEN